MVRSVRRAGMEWCIVRDVEGQVKTKVMMESLHRQLAIVVCIQCYTSSKHVVIP